MFFLLFSPLYFLFSASLIILILILIVNNNTIIIVEMSDSDSKGALVDFDLPYSITSIRKIGDPDKVAPPPQRNRPYYWRPPGV